MVFFIGGKQGRDQYVHVANARTWIAARDHCRQFYTDLASVRNDAEYQIIREVAGDQQVWVGLFRDIWVWSDQTLSSFRYWKTSKAVYTPSDGNCGALMKSVSGRWGERLRAEKHPFLCKCGEFFNLILSYSLFS